MMCKRLMQKLLLGRQQRNRKQRRSFGFSLVHINCLFLLHYRTVAFFRQQKLINKINYLVCFIHSPLYLNGFVFEPFSTCGLAWSGSAALSQTCCHSWYFLFFFGSLRSGDVTLLLKSALSNRCFETSPIRRLLCES